PRHDEHQSRRGPRGGLDHLPRRRSGGRPAAVADRALRDPHLRGGRRDLGVVNRGVARHRLPSRTRHVPTDAANWKVPVCTSSQSSRTGAIRSLKPSLPIHFASESALSQSENDSKRRPSASFRMSLAVRKPCAFSLVQLNHAFHRLMNSSSLPARTSHTPDAHISLPAIASHSVSLRIPP